MARTTPLQPKSAPWGVAWSGALAGFLLTIVLVAPARWLAGALALGSGERIHLNDARGSVWQGSAQLSLSGGEGSTDAIALPGPITWRIHPTWSGVVALITADCCTPKPLQLTVSPAGWSGAQLTLADGQSQWPAGLLAGLGTPWNTVQPHGQLAISSQGFGAQWVEGRLALSGRVQLDATHMSSRLSTIQPMGSYRLTLQGGAAPTLQLATLEGSLQLAGQGQWVGQKLRFVGEASAEPDRVEALSNLLNILGRRDGARSIIKVG